MSITGEPVSNPYKLNCSELPNSWTTLASEMEPNELRRKRPSASTNREGEEPLKRPLCYLAGPYTIGDVAINVRSQSLIWKQLWTDGIVVPYSPLFSHVAQLVSPISYEQWMAYSLEMLSRCDCLFRSDAFDDSIGYVQRESKGADLEEAFCRGHEKPIFYDKPKLYEWANSLTTKPIANPAQNDGSVARMCVQCKWMTYQEWTVQESYEGFWTCRACGYVEMS